MAPRRPSSVPFWHIIPSALRLSTSYRYPHSFPACRAATYESTPGQGPNNPSAGLPSLDTGATLPSKPSSRNESSQRTNALHVPAPSTKTEAAGTAGDNHPANEEPNDALIRIASQTTGWPAPFRGRDYPPYAARFLFQKSSKRYMLCYIVKHTAKCRDPMTRDYAGEP